MANNSLTDYNLPQNAYVAFDALTLKDFIISRLKEDGNFTDQIYEGSNLSSIIEIIAYSYHVLLFYLNSTATETTFSQASIYENMNKIVNLVGYKPTGGQTSTCSVNGVADSTLPIGNYTIRKYSYFLVDDIQYTFTDNYNFSKNTNDTEVLQAINDSVILYQGSVEQYPVYTANGEEFETLPVVVSNIVDEPLPRFISSGSISVYVKEVNSDRYYEYTETSSLFLAKNFDRVYDLRLNENGNYEIKFGNNIFGKKLNQGDEVVVYYILSDNEAGVISSNTISGNKLFTYSTQLFNDIYNDVYSSDFTTVITSQDSSSLTFSNPNDSSPVSNSETVDEMRQNVPLFVASNLKLATTNDYKFFLEKNLSSSLQSIYVASNKLFVSEYLDYFYKISVDPNKVNRVILNQVNFADSCDYNNVNIFSVPKFNVVEDDFIPQYVSTAVKKLIVDITEDQKMIGHEVVPRDPIYNMFKIGITNRSPSTLTPNNCKLIVVRENTNKIQRDTLKNRVTEVIRDFFNPSNNSLGQNILLSNLSSRILSIEGVKYIYTQNTTENITFDGISLVGWNPVYPEDDVYILNQDTRLPFFKFPYLGYPKTLTNYIEVVDE
jgi:hypothetical protein